MDVQEAIGRRRAVKRFDPAQRMGADEIDALLRLAILSPTAFNMQNWRFVLVTDPALRREIRAVSWDQAQVTDAALLVVLCADLLAWQRQPDRYWRDAPREVADFLVPAMDRYYRDRPQAQRDEAMRSCGIAAQTLMLAATAMGYDSCPMDGFDFDAVGRLIDLPEDHVIALFVAIGKPVQPANRRGGQLPLEEVLVWNRFG